MMNYEVFYDVAGNDYVICSGDARKHRGIPVAGFVTLAGAERYCQERGETNPRHYGTFMDGVVFEEYEVMDTHYKIWQCPHCGAVCEIQTYVVGHNGPCRDQYHGCECSYEKDMTI